MLLSNITSLQGALSTTIATTLGLYFILYALSNRIRHRRLQQKWGCAPVLRWPTWDPVFGTDFFLKRLKAFNEFRLLEELHKDFRIIKASTYQLFLGGDQIIWTIEPDNIQHILAAAPHEYCMGSRRQDTFKPFHGLGVFTLEGPEWRESRKDIKTSLERIQRVLIEKLDPHIDRLLEKIPRDGTIIELQRLFELMTLDTTTEFLWGESVKTLEGPEKSVFSSEFDEAIFRAQEGTGKRFNYGWFRFLLTPRKYWKDVKFIHDFIDERVEAQTQDFQSKGEKVATHSATFLDILRRGNRDRLRIRGELLQILMAGRDTTAALLSNAWFEMARHPEVFKRLQQEANDVCAEKITPGVLKGLDYLQAVFAEVLRLYPPISYNVREAIKDTQLPTGGGPSGQEPAFVPKGSLVAWNIYSLHRRIDVYGEDAETFRPERWLGEGKVAPGWAFLPFNGGERTCPGQAHAILEASYTTFRLLRQFEDLEWQDSAPWQEFLTLSCTNRRGCRVVVS